MTNPDVFIFSLAKVMDIFLTINLIRGMMWYDLLPVNKGEIVIYTYCPITANGRRYFRSCISTFATIICSTRSQSSNDRYPKTPQLHRKSTLPY